MPDDKRVAVLGAGMHPWGKWGRNFVEYGLAAAGDALPEAGLPWTDVAVRGRRRHHPQRLPRIHRRGHLRPGPGVDRGPGLLGLRRLCLGGPGHQQRPGPDPGRAVRRGPGGRGRHHPQGLLRPGRRRPQGRSRTGSASICSGATNPTYFALYARRRMELFGATEADFAAVKVKNARHGLDNANARYRKEVTADEVLASPMVADPLRLLEICATSDGGAALVLTSMEFARRHAGDRDLVTIDAVSTVTPRFPQTVIEMPNFSTDSAATAASVGPTFKQSVALAAYEEAGIGPEDVDLAEVYDLSSALELDWYEDIGLCKEGEAERLLRDGDTTIGGRVPVNPSGGLSCFGEAIPAQAIAQVCELVWQLRGQAGGPPGRGGQGRDHRQPGPVRPRLVGHRLPLAHRRASGATVQSVTRTIFPNLPPAANCS